MLLRMELFNLVNFFFFFLKFYLLKRKTFREPRAIKELFFKRFPVQRCVCAFPLKKKKKTRSNFLFVLFYWDYYTDISIPICIFLTNALLRYKLDKLCTSIMYYNYYSTRREMSNGVTRGTLRNNKKNIVKIN